MTGTDLYPIKQDQYSGRLEMVYATVMPKPGYHFEYDATDTRTEVKNETPVLLASPISIINIRPIGIDGYGRAISPAGWNSPIPDKWFTDRKNITKYEYEHASPFIQEKYIVEFKHPDSGYILKGITEVPVILLPILQPTVEDAEKIAITEVCGTDSFQEKLDTDSKEIADVARGVLAGLTKGISRSIIVGVVVGIILIKLVR